MSRLALIGAVLKKELRDGSRDRSSIGAAVFFPLFAPALVYFMLSSAIELHKDLDHLTLPVIGAEHAPALVSWLESQDVVLAHVAGDPREMVRSKRYKMVLVIPANFGERMAASRSAPVELVHDSSRTDAQNEVATALALLDRYSRLVSSLRLIARGISPEVTQAVVVQKIEIASKQQIGARVLTFIPMYIVMAAFICGMGLAVDSTAGERERSTLESLLINPVERTSFVIGKWIAASLLAAIGVFLTMACCFAALAMLPLEEIGISFSLGLPQAIGMLAVTVPLAMLATSMQLLLGIFARSFKDAQAYIGLLVLIPLIPGLIGTFHPIQSSTWMTVVPILGQHVLLMDVIGGKPIALIGFVLSACSALAAAYVCVQLTARLFARESIIFSR